MPDFGWEGDVSETEDDENDVVSEAAENVVSDVEENESDDTEETTETTDDEPKAVCSECGETHDDGACWDEDETVEEGTDANLKSPDEVMGEYATDGNGDDPFADIASDSMDLTDAQESEEKRRVMLWGPPATGKTHSVYTARKPLAIIDTERKAYDLADKFDVDPSKVRIWPVSDWDELEDAIDTALEWLRAWSDERGERGTLAVDSMSDAWEWAKVDYINRYYIEPDPTGKYEDPSDVELKSGLQSNDPDWPKIKQQHNDLRDRMVDSEFDLVWTAVAKEDYNAKIENEMSTTPYTWHGETNNDHKVNYIVHHYDDDDGQPVADLEKPGTTQHSFTGLSWPTLERVFDVVDDIKAAENAPESVSPGDVTEYDVGLVKGKPTVEVLENDD